MNTVKRIFRKQQFEQKFAKEISISQTPVINNWLKSYLSGKFTMWSVSKRRPSTNTAINRPVINSAGCSCSHTRTPRNDYI